MCMLAVHAAEHAFQTHIGGVYVPSTVRHAGLVSCVCVCVCACVCVCVMFIGISRQQESKLIPSNFVLVKTPGHRRSRRVIVTTKTKTVFVARPGSGWMVPTPRSPNVLLTPLYCNVLRHTATHYNTLQHTAAH